MTRIHATNIAAVLAAAVIGIAATPSVAAIAAPTTPRPIVEIHAVIPESTKPRRRGVRKVRQVVARVASATTRRTRTRIGAWRAERARRRARGAHYARGPPEAPEMLS